MIRSTSPKSQYSQYSTMLPPPPLPPMARPVAIIRSTGDLSMINSPTNSITPPNVNNMPSPQQTDHGQGTENTNADGTQSPPMSPHESQQHQLDHKSLSSTSSHSLARLASSYSTAPISGGRDYVFNPFHNTSTQVIKL